MGIYHIKCPICKEPTIWFSGSMDQRCELCKTKDLQNIDEFLDETLDEFFPTSPKEDK